jgi:hypothetical protein
MSWKDKIEQPFRIITGDGKEWIPLQMENTNTFSYNFNISEFEFPEVTGTKVDRRLPKGRRFPLEFYFQGDDNIDQGESFRISANDLRPWIIFHPVYGRIDGHPISITFDNSGINIVKVITEFVESITDDGPRITEDFGESAFSSGEEVEELASSITEGISPTVSDVNLMADTTSQMFEDAKGSISDSNVASEYQNVFTQATNEINSAIGNASFGIQTVQNFITYPYLFTQSVQNRLVVLVEQANILSKSIVNLTDKNKKTFFESFKSTLLVAMVKSAVTPNENDYQNAPDVLNVITILIDTYNNFIKELNFLKSENGVEIDSYNPDYNLQNELNYNVNYAVSNLLQIALTAQQERVIYLENDSNVIVQTHRFYGLDIEDVNLNRFISTNNVSLNELTQLKKGRKIVYYV